jgi:hypothetical protein
MHPSHQRDTAHTPIGTGRLRARRRFGYWSEQFGHIRDQSGRHFGARRPPRAIAQGLKPVRLVAIENLIAGLAGDAEFSTDARRRSRRNWSTRALVPFAVYHCEAR